MCIYYLPLEVLSSEDAQAHMQERMYGEMGLEGDEEMEEGAEYQYTHGYDHYGEEQYGEEQYGDAQYGEEAYGDADGGPQFWEEGEEAAYAEDYYGQEVPGEAYTDQDGALVFND